MIPRFFTCSVPDCNRPSVRAIGGCDSCLSYLCTTHIVKPAHLCDEKILDDRAYEASIVSEIQRLCSQIDNAAVCRLASQLNGDRPCDVEHSIKVGPGALMGAANYHARVRFRDGSPSWLLRVPRVATFSGGLPQSLVAHLVRSEYATLKFLETTKVPAPRVFAYGTYGEGIDHGVGLSFLLIEELPGRPWNGLGSSGNPATPDEKAKVWNGLADILAELMRHPFPKAGSLVPTLDGIEVSALASDRFLVLSPEGPFDNAVSYYTSFAEQTLSLIADGQLYTKYPIDAYLIYRFLKDNTHQLAVIDDKEDGQEGYILKHVDDKGDHLLVDEHLNVTGIIDWQMARVVPPGEALGPSLVTADMNALCNGVVSLSADDVELAMMLQARTSPDIVRYARDEKVRRFFWGLALESEWTYALPLAEAILEVFGVQKPWAQWRAEALEAYKGDQRLQDLICEGHDKGDVV